MNCAKVMRANTTYRCDEEPALVVVVSIDEFDLRSGID